MKVENIFPERISKALIALSTDKAQLVVSALVERKTMKEKELLKIADRRTLDRLVKAGILVKGGEHYTLTYFGVKLVYGMMQALRDD